MQWAVSYAYDAAGNRLQQTSPNETVAYTWNAAGQMATSEVPAGTVNYTYNAEAQRILKESTGGSLTGYLFDHQKLLNETDDVGAITETYLSDLTDEFGDLLGEDGQYVHQYDAQAQTNALLDDTGQVAAAYKYTAACHGPPRSSQRDMPNARSTSPPPMPSPHPQPPAPSPLTPDPRPLTPDP